jgi:hypothetical protein
MFRIRKYVAKRIDVIIDRRVSQVNMNNELVINTLRASIEASGKEISILKRQLEEISVHLRNKNIG